MAALGCQSRCAKDSRRPRRATSPGGRGAIHCDRSRKASCRSTRSARRHEGTEEVESWFTRTSITCYLIPRLGKARSLSDAPPASAPMLVGARVPRARPAPRTRSDCRTSRAGGGPPGTSAPTRGSGHVPATSTAAGLSPDVGVRLLQDVLDILQVSRQGRDVQLQFELSLRQQHDKCHVSVRHLLIISAQFKNIASLVKNRPPESSLG